MTDKTVSYSGVVPKYIIDGTEINMPSTPALINSRGIAMCSASTVFKEAGVRVSSNTAGDQIIFKFNDKVLTLFLNSTKALLNDKETEASCASYKVKYLDSKKTVTLVPSRFVADSLGINYTWNASESTVTMLTPVKLKYHDEIMYYGGTQGRIKIDGNDIDNSDYPSIILSNNALISLDAISGKLDNTKIDYQKSTGRITITCEDITLVLFVDNTNTLVNGVAGSAPIAPARIKNYKTGTNGIYIPGRYVFETLGYKYVWTESTGISAISHVKNRTGKYSPAFETAIIFDPENEQDRYYPDYYQEFRLPIPSDIDAEEVEITDLLYDNMFRVELEGDYRDFYKNALNNSGEALWQVNVLYYPSKDITQINMCTRSDENGMLLGHKEYVKDNTFFFTIDEPQNLFDRIIVLDAGHGGNDPGTIHGGYREKDLNSSIINTYCRQYFDDTDIKVFYARTDDSRPGLYERAALAERTQADLFISVHHNSLSNTKYSGTTVYYSSENKGTFKEYDSKAFAQIMCSNLTSELETVNRGAADKNYVVVSENNSVPAILIEVGFMSNPNELKRLTTAKFQKKTAKTIYDTVLQIYGD